LWAVSLMTQPKEEQLIA